MKTNLVIAALCLLPMVCPAPVSPKIASAQKNARMMKPMVVLAEKAIAKSKTSVTAAAVVPPKVYVPKLYWPAIPGATGYVLRGSDFANVNLTNVLVLGNVTNCVDPNWAYVELSAVNGNAAQDSIPISGNRLRQSTNEVSFIPFPGKTTRLESSTDLKTWSLFRAVTGSSVANITVPTTGVKFYRLVTP